MPRRRKSSSRSTIFGSAAAVPAGERIGAQQEHRTGDVPTVFRPDSDRVADQQVLLESRGVLGVDPLRGERAKTRGDAVDDLARFDELLHDGAAGGHSLASRVVESRRRTTVGDAFDFLEGQVEAGQRDGMCRRSIPGRSTDALLCAWSLPSSSIGPCSRSSQRRHGEVRPVLLEAPAIVGQWHAQHGGQQDPIERTNGRPGRRSDPLRHPDPSRPAPP